MGTSAAPSCVSKEATSRDFLATMEEKGEVKQPRDDDTVWTCTCIPRGKQPSEKGNVPSPTMNSTVTGSANPVIEIRLSETHCDTPESSMISVNNFHNLNSGQSEIEAKPEGWQVEALAIDSRSDSRQIE